MGLDYLLPEGLDLDGMFPDVSPLTIEYARLLITMIIRREAAKINEWESPWVPLHCKWDIERNIPVRQAKTVKEMLRGTVIDFSDGYVVGEHAKHFRLIPPWDSRPISVVPCESASLEQRLWGMRKDDICPCLPIHERLAKDLVGLELSDANAAERIAARQRKDWKKKMYRKQTARIVSRDFYFKPKFGRVYTNFTNCPTPIRKLLTWKGQRLAQVDITATQPYLLWRLSENPDNNNEYYHYLFCEGGFYDEWLRLGEYRYRDEGKLACVSYINDTIGKCDWSKERAIFRHLCPEASAYRESFNGKLTDEKPPKNVLSRVLHKSESDWVMEVCVRLAAKLVGVPILTLHDAIFVLPRYTALVDGLLKEVAAEMFGIPPHTKIKMN